VTVRRTGHIRLQYDHAGRLISRRPTSTNTSTAETEGYAYDVQDQLRAVRARVAGTSQVVEVIDYDPTGLPLFRRVGSVGTWFVGKMATVTATVSTSCLGAATCTPLDTPKVAVHLLLGGNRIATVKPPALAATTGAFDEVLYYHRDYQGSVIGTSRRGSAVDGLAGAKYRYTPYGQLDRADNVTALTDSDLGYTGGIRLGWTVGVTPPLPQAPGLVLLGARVYHPELKRWLVPDTVDPLRYTYTGGDPVNFIDPSGRVMLEHGRGDGPPKAFTIFEDYFMALTAQYATAGFDSAASHQRSDAAWAAGNQAPEPVVVQDHGAYVDSGSSDVLLAANDKAMTDQMSDGPNGLQIGVRIHTNMKLERIGLTLKLDPAVATPSLPPPLSGSEAGSYAAGFYAALIAKQDTPSLTKGAAWVGLVLSSFWTAETAPRTFGLAGVFIGQFRGPSIVVPNNAVGPTPSFSGKGVVYTGGQGGPGLDARVSGVRIMEPTAPRGPSPGYPSGYAVYSNSTGQPVNPMTGQTVSPQSPTRHIPLTP
jgi:RHS repeat-associated protein